MVEPKVEGHFEVYRALGRDARDNPYLIPFFHELWRAARTYHVPDYPPFTPGSVGSPENTEQIDVLFLPIMGRDHYIGSCKMVAEALHYYSSHVKIAFLKTNDYTFPDDFLDYVEILEWQDTAVVENEFCDQDPDETAEFVKNKIAGNEAIIPWVNLDAFGERIGRTFKEIDVYRSFLRRRKVKFVAAANEMLPESMTMLAAARLENVPFIQFLHGWPHRFYAPFLSDEMWVWSTRSQQAFINYGVEKERLPIVGSLELSYLKSVPTPPQPSITLPGKKTLLCCLQYLHRTRFMNTFDLVKEAFPQLPDDWNLKLRVYPGRNDDFTIDLINESFGMFEGRVAYTCNTPFLDDLAEADIVCTGSSTAGLIAAGLGYKSLILWNDEFSGYVGGGVVDPARICYSPEQLVQKALNPSSIPDAQESELGNMDDAPYLAASRIMMNLIDS